MADAADAFALSGSSTAQDESQLSGLGHFIHVNGILLKGTNYPNLPGCHEQFGIRYWSERSWLCGTLPWSRRRRAIGIWRTLRPTLSTSSPTIVELLGTARSTRFARITPWPRSAKITLMANPRNQEKKDDSLGKDEIDLLIAGTQSAR